MENLGAKLLLGMNVLRHERFRRDLDAKTAGIGTCMGLTASSFFTC